MDCPACKNKHNKILSTDKWSTIDRRNHECLSCGYRFKTITMLVEDEALLECAALVTRKFYESRDAYDPKTDRLKKFCYNTGPIRIKK